MERRRDATPIMYELEHNIRVLTLSASDHEVIIQPQPCHSKHAGIKEKSGPQRQRPIAPQSAASSDDAQAQTCHAIRPKPSP